MGDVHQPGRQVGLGLVILAVCCLAALMFWLGWQLTARAIVPGYQITVPHLVLGH